jgi:hypothetical protein
MAVAVFMAVTFAFLAFVLIAVDWAAGYRAALRLMPLHLLTGIALLVAVLCAPTVGSVHLVGIGGASAFVLVTLFTGIIAGRAAKAVNDQLDG